MDLYCPLCGEPTENDTFHDVAQERGLCAPYWLPDGDPFGSQATRVKNPAYSSEASTAAYETVAKDFRTRGCPAIGAKCSEPSTEVDPVYGLTRQQAASALYELGDMDAAAAELGDMF